jgi:hypothetical protein
MDPVRVRACTQFRVGDSIAPWLSGGSFGSTLNNHSGRGGERTNFNTVRRLLTRLPINLIGDGAARAGQLGLWPCRSVGYPGVSVSARDRPLPFWSVCGEVWSSRSEAMHPDPSLVVLMLPALGLSLLLASVGIPVIH